MTSPTSAASTTTRVLTVTGLPGGEDLDVPYWDVRGGADGPWLTLLAGVHGTEHTSSAAVRQLLAELDPAVLSGRITAVPVLNLPAFWARSPFVVPVDGKNLNRCFPGDPGGSYTDVLAHAAFEHLVLGRDALVDLHAGDLPEALEPFALYEESAVGDRSLSLARAYGVSHVVRQSRSERTVGGSTSAAAADAGIPAVVAEAGANGLLDPSAVATHRRGLDGVLRHLGMLAPPDAGDPGAPGGPPPSAPAVVHEGWHWLRTPVAGWWEATVVPGQDVRAGQLLGAVSDLLGRELVQVRAPEDGVPLFVTTSPAVVADGLLLGLARA